ncbi:hypothetical protein HMPREF3218_0200556 [Prevotella bivia]|uniref:Uncharacterized protein n=1 Tax=Prevotella bivia TaxID=28125 RepID=A0A137STA0_9BACT|nr:hypothetical protein HMPREF3202_01636 [Prevotella bivia]KXU59643.1 hypothetical protein HMPREF3218_0200556 [Prevotella bivia]
MNKIIKRRYNLVYCLRKKGVRCLSKERIIFFPYNQNPNAIRQISCLCREYHFHVQLEL